MGEKVVNIAKNTSYFTFALILQKVISFSYFTILARELGPEDLGKYYFAISLTTIFAIFIDFGFANILTREVAKDNSKAGQWLGSTLMIKLPLTVLTIIGLAVLTGVMDYSPLVKSLIYLSAVCMILDSYTLSFFSTIRGFHNLFYESIASVIFQVVVMAFGLTVLYSGFDLRWQMGALVAASVFHFLYSSFFLKFKLKVSIKPIFDRNLMKLLLKISLPFGVFAVLQRAYVYLDSVLLSILAGDRDLGLYQVSFKIIFAIQFLPMAFVASLYPAFSSYWKSNREQLVVTFERAMNYLIIISFPISAGIMILADKIMLLFKSDYNDAILPLQVIMFSLVFIFLNFPVGSLLNACDKQKINTINMAVGLALSVVMNLLLIPKLQATGASITVVITNLVMFVMGMYWVPKIIPYRPKKIMVIFYKTIISTLIMALTAYFLKPFLNIFIVIFISGIIYLLIMFIVGGFRKEDVTSILESFKKTKTVINKS